tara:strand:- start:39 stop:503 length:465 start_codon:yes stop_codon:yes gene_type:complete
MIKLLKLSLIVFFLKLSFLKAEVIKPSTEINPEQVVKIQLAGLMKNDLPYKDKGIEQTWEFAHPNNKKVTGPLNKFKQMIKGESYKMLIDHENHEVKQIFLNNEVAVFEVVIMDIDKKYFKFKWQVEKYLNIGPLENCWLTTVVSEPVPMGASI